MPLFAVITGEGGAARTACALSIAEALEARGLRVGGFVQIREQDGRGRRAHALMRLCDGARVPLGVRGIAPREAESGHCAFAFQDDAFVQARAWLESEAPDRDVLMVGDLGSLETGGQGHGPALAAALASGALVILTIQPRHLFYALERYAPDDAPLAAVDAPEDALQIQALVEAVASAR